MNLRITIDDAISTALAKAGAIGSPAMVRQAKCVEFGHYQANGVMGAAKKLGMNPRKLAEKVIALIDLPLAASIEIAGPGFINIRLDPNKITKALTCTGASDRLAVDKKPQQTVVVDYSAPNLAKEMHIGHLRSTTIGDAMVRVLEFPGHKVVRVNHVGDWGAQFGSLLAYLDLLNENEISTQLKDLEKFYQAASKLFKSDKAFAARARDYVVKLQSGDERCLTLWQTFIEVSISHCQHIYEKLDITLTRDDIAAESSYNDVLPLVVKELTEKGLLVESDGALCVFLEEFKGKDSKPLPAIIRKSDGGYPYMATDIAAVRHRSKNLNANLALYVVGAPQTLHFQQVFAIATAAGYLDDTQGFAHLSFGNILNSDGKMFKTRDGADVKLIDVIDEAVNRAYELVSSKNLDLPEIVRRDIAHVVGVGAMKYAELSKNRITDYKFDWDTMLSFEGNTAPYLQYAYTRIISIFKRAEIHQDTIKGEITLTEPAEFKLGVKLLQFPEALDVVLDDYQANALCTYLYELAVLFMSFYEACPILKSDESTKLSRLILSDITARTLQQGLDLLGIRTVEQM